MSTRISRSSVAEWRGELRLALLTPYRIEFHVNPDEPIIDLNPNRRYMAHFVEIQEEQVNDPEERRPVSRGGRAPSVIATALCADKEFQAWCSEALVHEGRGRLPATQETAIELIRMRCGIQSFEMLEMNAAALKIFHDRVELPYYRYKSSR